MTPTDEAPTAPNWRELVPEDGPALQYLFERDAEHFERSFGHPPGVEATSAFYAMPNGFPPERKLLLGSFIHSKAASSESGAMTAFADLLRGWPGPDTWTIATLFIDPVERGQGLALALWQRLEVMARQQGASRLRAAPAHDQPRAVGFFRKQGLVDCGAATKRIGERSLHLRVMEKELPPL